MFISTKKEYLLTDSVCIAGLNKKRIKTTENNGIGHLNTGSVPVVWILHFSMKLFWETKLKFSHSSIKEDLTSPKQTDSNSTILSWFDTIVTAPV